MTSGRMPGPTSLLDAWAALERPQEAVRTFHDGRAVLHAGDCLEAVRAMPANSIDSVCCDPPYALVSIGKRFGKEGAAPALSSGATGVYARASAGFMGKTWDTGQTAFAVEFWVEVLRVLKPGGHLLAFGGTRTYHRLAVAIEDAGFEVRDCVQWLYGSGFPKSHDVSKGIDKGLKAFELFDAVRDHIRYWRNARGLTNDKLNDIVGSSNTGCGMARHWTSTEGGQHSIPSKEQWAKLKLSLCWNDCALDAVYNEVKDGAARPVLGTHDSVAPAALWRENYNLGIAGEPKQITGSATDAAREWEGWGTALKPACEIICLARKPLSEGTVAANVLAHGTGALNIDACRARSGPNSRHVAEQAAEGTLGWGKGRIRSREDLTHQAGRWPANVLLSYPEDDYMLRDDVTPDQRRELFRWMSENAEHEVPAVREAAVSEAE